MTTKDTAQTEKEKEKKMIITT